MPAVKTAIKISRAPRTPAATSAAPAAVADTNLSSGTAATKQPVIVKAQRATSVRKAVPQVAARALPSVAGPVKAASRAAAPPVLPVLPAASLPLAKPKHKLVRDSFTIPKTEYIVLENLKLRAANLKRPTKKSEVLRAGVAVLQAMGDKAFLAALNAVPSLKTGRPKSEAVVAPTPVHANKSR